MKYLATFYTHYGAMSFHKRCKKSGVSSKMAPVPRELSSSCGVCVLFDSAAPPKTAEHEDLERCYAITENGGYTQAEG